MQQGSVVFVSHQQLSLRDHVLTQVSSQCAVYTLLTYIHLGTSMVTRSRSKTAKPRPRRKLVSTIPLTTPDVPRPTPPASKRSCSHERKSLTTDNFDELLDDLYPAVNKWYYIGLGLGLRPYVLKAIATKQRDDSLDCLREMLITRLEMEKLSKEELIQSLQKPTVRLFELAQKLKDSKQW